MLVESLFYLKSAKLVNKPVIVLEFNELSPVLMRRFIAQGELPNFARLQAGSQCYVTDAGEEPPNLEPWIQWVTVHTGLAYAQHGVFNLGDGWKVGSESIWDVVSRSNQRVWVCGSMNAFHESGTQGWILPDPWSVHVRPNTSELAPYFEFVRAQVLEYTRTNQRLGLREALRFVWFMMRHGLSMSTVTAIISQLVKERFGNVRWKRATLLDRLQFDLFRHVYRTQRPRLSTFFINSTAHLQHCYWRNMDPAPFTIKPSQQDQRDYAGAVLYGYKAMDRIVGETLEMAGDDATIVFATALGQQPCLTYEGSGGKCFYKPEDFNRLLSAAGIDPGTCQAEPVMSEEFHLRFQSSEAARQAESMLSQLKLDGQSALKCKVDGASILAGCCVFRELPPDARLTTAQGSVRFAEVFYFVDMLKSGMHHPEGLLWIRRPGQQPTSHPGSVPLVNVAPTILRLLDVPIPAAMSGRSLLT